MFCQAYSYIAEIIEGESVKNTKLEKFKIDRFYFFLELFRPRVNFGEKEKVELHILFLRDTQILNHWKWKYNPFENFRKVILNEL